jgi:predicted RNA binding protein YcfA (HicA-like mRNA interferase family)
MVGRLPQVTAREVVRALRRDGWYLDEHGSRHDVYRHPTKPGIVPAPRHPSIVVKQRTLAAILAQAGISREQFRRRL